ncbi:hypothetical protein RI367_008395 [Sorochytrium milnesiophthora]
MSDDPRLFDYSNPPRFGDGVYGFLIFSVPGMGFGALQGLFLCRVLLRDKTILSTGRASDLLTLNLMVSNTTFCLIEAILAAIKVAGRSYNLGFTMCQLEGFFLASTAVWSMSAAFLLGLDRFLTIVMERALPIRTWWRIMGATGVVVVVIKMLPFILGLPYVVQPSGLYCEQNFRGQGLCDLGLTAATVAFDMIVVLLMIAMYGAIYIKVRRVRRSVSAALQHTNSLNAKVFTTSEPATVNAKAEPPKNTPKATASYDSEAGSSLSKRLSLFARRPSAVAKKRHDEVEHATFVKAVAISSVAFLAWMPYNATMAAAANGASPNVLLWMDCFSILLVGIRCHCEGHIVAMLDPGPRQALHDAVHKMNSVFTRK